MTNFELRQQALDREKFRREVMLPIGISLVSVTAITLILLGTVTPCLNCFKGLAHFLSMSLHCDRGVVTVVFLFALMIPGLVGAVLVEVASHSTVYRREDVLSVNRSYEEIVDGSLVTVVETLDGPVVRLPGSRKIGPGSKLSCSCLVLASTDVKLCGTIETSLIE